eukprot:3443294-Ditylum_brightwellii.AAC.1
MSRINRGTAPTVIEPEEFEETEKVEEEQYKPQQPQLAFMEARAAEKKTDHLENYIEVDPFANKKYI